MQLFKLDLWDLLPLLLGLASAAVCWSYILVQPGMLLTPAQRAWRTWYRSRYNSELDDAQWWNPLWGCPKCVCGQWCLWLCLIKYFPQNWNIGLWAWACWLGSLIVFVSWGILATMLLMKFVRWAES